MNLSSILVGLALEGIPVGAMARATRTASADVWPVLREARDRGEIVDLPRSDWPPGVSRHDRQQHADDGPALEMVQLAFGCSPQEARLLSALIGAGRVPHARLHRLIVGRKAEADAADVLKTIVCRTRKVIAPAEIIVVRGWGYGLGQGSRQVILDRLAPFQVEA